MTTTQKTTRFRDYGKGKIYKIIAPDTDEVYIGSTIQTLPQRLSKHTSDARLWRGDTSRKYCYSEMMLRNEGYKIELLYDFPCGSLAELSREEGETAKLFPTRVNKNVAGRTREEWFQDNNTTEVEYKRKWRQNNPEKVKESFAIWRNKNPEKYKENYVKQNQKKKNNPETKEYKKEYYLKNKDKYKDKKLADKKKLKQDIKFKEDLETHEMENEII
ncbi:GIY-YIG superfamily endonuclease [Preplasmiviricota sp. Gezel-14T]|uniref:Mavirus MV06-like protein n=1 Tax=Preplasmiviricota sp. Gezel-14T TaxID=1335638 RepID=UPI000332B889|nr:Mavirus MV06-like protein [Preplasmiviricota sp. Gezel-14T]AGM15748.1 Mavirus MV06-like protein [Preplasmiviricota sp. Gezel-14T]UYE94479.1 GIY-YIG superfamily endonuclease [Preplasmiviricota sp. Gezel-14T]